MRRISLFVILTITALISLIATVAAGFYVLTSQNQTNANRWGSMWNGMMGGMMGGNSGTSSQTQNNLAPYFGLVFFVLIGIAVVGVAGLIYYLALPEIKNNPAVAQPLMTTSTSVAIDKLSPAQPTEAETTPYSSVLKTLNIDERKVVEALSAHNGKYLQKYIRNETGLSRLQTHRIVARLAERGIISLEKTGNTNTVMLASWLK